MKTVLKSVGFWSNRSKNTINGFASKRAIEKTKLRANALPAQRGVGKSISALHNLGGSELWPTVRKRM